MQCAAHLLSKSIERSVEKAVSLVALSGAIAIAIGFALLASEIAPVVSRRGR